MSFKTKKVNNTIEAKEQPKDKEKESNEKVDRIKSSEECFYIGLNNDNDNDNEIKDKKEQDKTKNEKSSLFEYNNKCHKTIKI